MNGIVDSQGRALLLISVRPAQDANNAVINVWVDAGFNGDLVLPKNQIEQLGLKPSVVIQTTLADGRQTAIESSVAWVEWIGLANFKRSKSAPALAKTSCSVFDSCWADAWSWTTKHGRCR